MTQDRVERVTNGSYEPDDMSAIGDAARRIASYCEGEARLNVYRKAKLELAAIEATGVVELRQRLEATRACDGPSASSAYLFGATEMTLDELILEQQQASANAKHWQERDRELRSLIWGEAFGSKGCEDGTQHTTPLGNGYKLKDKRPVSYKVSGDVDAALEAIAAIGNEGSFIADRLVKWTPSLSLTEYNSLSDDMRKLIDPCVTTTPGLPVIEVVEPK